MGFDHNIGSVDKVLGEVLVIRGCLRVLKLLLMANIDVSERVTAFGFEYTREFFLRGGVHVLLLLEVSGEHLVRDRGILFSNLRT